jgi:hypothetical protein
MTRTTLALTSFLVALTLTAPMAQAASIVAALTQVEAQGYEILEVDSYGTRIEIDAIKSDGTRVELIVETATGEIVSERLDD